MSFPRYPEYKDSGVKWLGKVPGHWRFTKLKWYASVYSGRDQKADSGSWPIYGANGPIGECHEPSIFSPRVLVGRVGSAGAVNYVTEPCGVSDNALIVENNSSLNSRFVFYILAMRDFSLDISTTAQPLLTGSLLKDQEIPIPETKEQIAIATFLDRETAKIDALVAEQERLIALLQEKCQEVISHAVTKGLDPNVSMKDSGVEWLGDVPAHWEVSQLRYVVREGTSITYGIVQAGPEVEDGVPYIRTSDMSGNALPLTGYPKTSPEIDAAYARSKVNAGDLVISIRASVGKCLPVPPELDGANLTQGTAKIAPGAKAPAAFMLPFISSKPVQLYLDSKAKGATFKEITLETLRKTPFLVPPLDEQLRIAKWVSDQDQQFSALIDAAEQAQKLLRERRTALISAAVTGQIDVRSISSREVA